ncbi:hypothetical protein T03_3046 [Trichinella britovi]|uniref:Uncharacterized protein n=1 Tax=Trichinella britovi TaxID=45882 RepID=A0A0V1D1X8_TRIBR|nr:hypothetical protein T03_3046 [Trichinella britovi]
MDGRLARWALSLQDITRLIHKVARSPTDERSDGDDSGKKTNSSLLPLWHTGNHALLPECNVGD